ncbi:hypothetical protein PS874_01564 [Pseudomonas fluorescens]|nr:hypothetical protein PS874_01564 [Pseudomonas fluorescens]
MALALLQIGYSPKNYRPPSSHSNGQPFDRCCDATRYTDLEEI